uniref:Uncharacterized protein n=1 Tax=Setaria viridis TaxID=4556 RepID=A0A4U6T8Y5_SETVI|nr:LOW QUALITY PROTEIN: hypothetical protein SEVIR_9G480500v2 [Setaria viridis]
MSTSTKAGESFLLEQYNLLLHVPGSTLPDHSYGNTAEATPPPCLHLLPRDPPSCHVRSQLTVEAQAVLRREELPRNTHRQPHPPVAHALRHADLAVPVRPEQLPPRRDGGTMDVAAGIHHPRCSPRVSHHLIRRLEATAGCWSTRRAPSHGRAPPPPPAHAMPGWAGGGGSGGGEAGSAHARVGSGSPPFWRTTRHLAPSRPSIVLGAAGLPRRRHLREPVGLATTPSGGSEVGTRGAGGGLTAARGTARVARGEGDAGASLRWLSTTFGAMVGLMKRSEKGKER